MNPTYKRLEATAKRLIKQYGKPSALIRQVKTGPAHHPVVTEQRHDIVLVETGYSMTNRSETLVQVGDKLGIISTAAEAPLQSDVIEIDGKRYSFVDVEPLNPGGLTLLYEFHARS